MNSLQQQPLVSVVIPCYKQAHFLSAALESVQAQTHPHYEIIVVDDGSPDETAQVAARYAGVRCLRQRNRGLAAARNAGLQASRGAYVVFLDADDRLLPEALAHGLACLQANADAVMTYGGYQLIDETGALLPLPPWLYEGADCYYDLLTRNYFGTVAAALYRRQIFAEVGGFDTSISPAADYDLYLRIARRRRINIHQQLVSEYRVHQHSMSQNNAAMLRAVIIALRRQEQYVQGRQPYEKAWRAGLDFWRTYYGEPLYWGTVKELGRLDSLPHNLRNLACLLNYYPQSLARHGGDWLAKLTGRIKDGLRVNND